MVSLYVYIIIIIIIHYPLRCTHFEIHNEPNDVLCDTHVTYTPNLALVRHKEKKTYSSPLKYKN